MLSFYVAALVVGIGVLVVQIAAGHDGDLGGHDVDHGGGHGDQDAAPWSIVASVRFWAFALLAFGLVGALLHVFALAPATIILALASASGVASGVVAVTVVRRLLAQGPSSVASRADVVGRVGRVVVPIGDTAGKVRVEVKGALVDVVARAREPLDAGEAVVVEEVTDAGVIVSRAPRELAP